MVMTYGGEEISWTMTNQKNLDASQRDRTNIDRRR